MDPLKIRDILGVELPELSDTDTRAYAGLFSLLGFKGLGHVWNIF